MSKVVLVICFFSSLHGIAQKLVSMPGQPEWSKATEPFRLAGNLYYVGTYDLASYLITTSKGHVLINTGLAESTSMIRANVEKLGFVFSDIKVLLATHAHYDHVGAMAEIKKLSGAKMFIQEGDGLLMADGGNSDFLFGGKGPMFGPVKPDRLLQEEDTVRIDGVSIIALHHPGHTKGASSFLLDVKDETRSYRVLIANMPTILEQTKLSGMPTYPNVGLDYAHTLAAMKKIKFDLWCASHASQFRLHEKRKPGARYDPEVFRDQKGYDAAMED